MTTINNIKSTVKVLFFVILLIGATNNTYSQLSNQNAPQQEQLENDSDAEEMTPPDDNDPQNVPFDGGASILIASGVAYGAKKYRERKKKSEE